jgi:hypothetical protein
MRKYLRLASVTMALLAPHVVQAAPERLLVNDASLVQFTVNVAGGPNYVFFRNFADFGSGWHGCCGDYFIDLSTEGGKAQYATFLSAYLSKQKVVFFVEKNGGALLQVGNF